MTAEIKTISKKNLKSRASWKVTNSLDRNENPLKEKPEIQGLLEGHELAPLGLVDLKLQKKKFRNCKKMTFSEIRLKREN